MTQFSLNRRIDTQPPVSEFDELVGPANFGFNESIFMIEAAHAVGDSANKGMVREALTTGMPLSRLEEILDWLANLRT